MNTQPQNKTLMQTVEISQDHSQESLQNKSPETPQARREFLKSTGLMIVGGLLIPKYSIAKKVIKKPKIVKSLKMYNIHTGEHMNITYCEDDKMCPIALSEANKFFRDRRSNEQIDIDTGLLDLLHSVQKRSESSRAVQLISGYRCPKTNAMLRKRSKKVAKNSFHMKGMAADINIPGVSLKSIRKLACELGAGGVGYYPKSGFVHMDVRQGSKKRW